MDQTTDTAQAPDRRPAVRRALRARCMWRRVRRGRGRAVAGAGPAAGPGRSGGARPSGRVRGRRRVERWRRGRAASRPVGAGTAGRGRGGRSARDRLALPARGRRRSAGPGARRGDLRRRRPDGRRAGGPCPSRRRARVGGRRVATDDRPGDRGSPGPRRGRPAPPQRRRLRAPPGRRPAPARDRGPCRRRRPRRDRGPVRLGADHRLQGPGHRCPAARPVPRPACAAERRVRGLPPALRDQHDPVWRLAQPFRSISHNGEINTVRGNREQVRGRAADAGDLRDRPRAPRGRPAAVRRAAPIRCPSTRPSNS